MKGTVAIARSTHFVEAWKFSESLTRMLINTPDVSFIVGEQSNTYRNRQELLKHVQGEWVLFIDTDMLFEADACNRLEAILLENDLDVVCGLANAGSPPYGPAIMKPWKEGEKLQRWVRHPGGLVQIGGCGMFFTMIRRRVFEALEEPFQPIWNIDYLVDGDLSFCLKAQRAGFKIWCDTSLKIGHLRMRAI